MKLSDFDSEKFVEGDQQLLDSPEDRPPYSKARVYRDKDSGEVYRVCKEEGRYQVASAPRQGGPAAPKYGEWLKLDEE